MAKGKKNIKSTTPEVEEVKKVKTGETTDLGFIRALKAKGIDAKAEFPAETLRTQLDSLDDTDVSFLSTNETVLEVINAGEPTPVEEVKITVSVSGIEAGDEPVGTIGEEVITSFPAEITRVKDTVETLVVSCEGYVPVEQEVTFSENGSVEVELVRAIVFEGATVLDVSGATEYDNPGIVENDGKYTVESDGTAITVTDQGLIPYVGGNISEPKKWVGILVDLGVKVSGVEYTIEDVDYSDAERWGAQNDTTFIMWLTTEQGGDFTFKNIEDENNTITLTVAFVESAE
jgi:hypothetical protein